MTVDVGEVKSDLLDAFEHDKLVLLPTLPGIALLVREAANDPNTDTPRLQDIIGNDAALSACVVRVANGPLLRGMQSIENLQAALSRLGVTCRCKLGLEIETQRTLNGGCIAKISIWRLNPCSKPNCR